MGRSKNKNKIPGEQVWEEAFEAIDHAPLLERLGVVVDKQWLKLALTHRSFANEHGHLPNNERLEFVGDAVLGLSVAGRLYDDHPSRPESDISKMRASIVSRYGLAEVAHEIHLGDYILLGKGETATGGREKDSILADTMEAVFGAIYMQYGFEPTRDVILNLFADKLAVVTATGLHSDWKTALQERLAELKAPTAVYSATAEGVDHDPTFTASVTVGEVQLGQGIASNKKKAEQMAALEAVKLLHDNPGVVARIDA
ncbi:ribonuclease III [Corynebacterium aquatimens]|uniref:Ribonuclease 3 n=1 Tax=Corynebacterium aquatimens TaxID=1190508 RepID=A0A931GRF5_9CORY|nr:ribonuclease III [Corynebacterium aquatimens]MBG6121903.1 ribonuclease-3 [Corynebacterium aquatimens]WJY65559.1 Ribonuclease 3 [Corynebacterium aquatimens]